MSTVLTDLRKQLDLVDDQIVDLLDKRFKISDLVAKEKNASNIPITNHQRELEVISRTQNRAHHPALKQSIPSIYEQIISANKSYRQFHRYNDFPFNKIGILGLGMIGGSIIKGIKTKKPEISIATLKRNSDNNSKAIQDHYIDIEYSSLSDLVKNVDLLILAIPIESIIVISNEIAKIQLKDKLIIIDVASTKGDISQLFESLSNDTIEYIPTHPMAGSHNSGFEHAQPELFINQPWIVCEHNRNLQISISKITSLITFLGSNPVYLDGIKHDEQVAIVSHLIFVISTYLFAYANLFPDTLKIAGSGFRSTTRLASGNVDMHTQISHYNFENINRHIEGFIQFIEDHALSKNNLLDFFELNKRRRDTYIKETYENS
ncbi:MAG: prephenate dehydrogenase/arogenate dehydrogenase family protein [Candidatus Roizmanbacteria bacterium]